MDSFEDRSIVIVFFVVVNYVYEIFVAISVKTLYSHVRLPPLLIWLCFRIGYQDPELVNAN